MVDIDVFRQQFLTAQACQDWGWVKDNIDDLCKAWISGEMDEVIDSSTFMAINEKYCLMLAVDGEFFIFDYGEGFGTG